jgi:hypothetical protein
MTGEQKYDFGQKLLAELRAWVTENYQVDNRVGLHAGDFTHAGQVVLNAYRPADNQWIVTYVDSFSSGKLAIEALNAWVVALNRKTA